MGGPGGAGATSSCPDRLLVSLAPVRAYASAHVPVHGGDCDGLFGYLERVPDPRKPRGIRHGLASILATCAAAVLTGATSLLAIMEWVHDAPQEVLAALRSRWNARRGRYVAPHKATVRRVLEVIDAAATDAALCSWVAARAGIRPAPTPGDELEVAAVHEHSPGVEPDAVPVGAFAVDGKSVRGAVGAEGKAVHLLSVLSQDHAVVISQVEVGQKTNEITHFQQVLDPLDLTDVVITADALHTQRSHARYLRRRGGHFVLPVGENQPKLFDYLDKLPWTTVPITFTQHHRGHGRAETRTIQVVSVGDDVPFPHVAQAYLLERNVHDLATGKHVGAVAALGITSLTAAQAAPQQLATYVRGQWKIEANHWIRDAVFREDASTIRTGSLPQVLAALRNNAIGMLRLNGNTKIASGLRHNARDFHRPLQHLGLQPIMIN
jgi:predicted transposase YbfD/YdcC